MRALENVAAAVLAAFFLILLPAGIRAAEGGSTMERAAEESVTALLSDIRAKGELTEERYSALEAFLYSCGYMGGFEVTEYYYEDGIDGEKHQYAVSDEEIRMELLRNGTYRFKEGSYVYVRVPGYFPEQLLARIFYGRKPLERSIAVG